MNRIGLSADLLGQAVSDLKGKAEFQILLWWMSRKMTRCRNPIIFLRGNKWPNYPIFFADPVVLSNACILRALIFKSTFILWIQHSAGFLHCVWKWKIMYHDRWELRCLKLVSHFHACLFLLRAQHKVYRLKKKRPNTVEKKLSFLI